MSNARVGNVQVVGKFPQFRRWRAEPRKPLPLPADGTAFGRGRQHPMQAWPPQFSSPLRCAASPPLPAETKTRRFGGARNNTEKPPCPASRRCRFSQVIFRGSSVSRDAGFRVRRGLEPRRDGAESTFHARTSPQEWKGGNRRKAVSRHAAFRGRRGSAFLAEGAFDRPLAIQYEWLPNILWHECETSLHAGR